MGKKKSLRSKAVHFVTGLTTGLLNPISDKPSEPPHPFPENVSESKTSQSESTSQEENGNALGCNLNQSQSESSFSPFLSSLLSSSELGCNLNLDEQNDNQEETSNASSDTTMKENGGRKSLLSRGKQSLKALYQATRSNGYRNQDRQVDSNMKSDDEGDAKLNGLEMRRMQNVKEQTLGALPETSEPSLLLTEKTRNDLYASLPALVQGRKWLLLYSTWRHGISLSTLYRRSMLWPGLSLLVVGDRKGAVFGGLVEAPLKPTNKKYQGTNSTFVFTNRPGDPVVFYPTGTPIFVYHLKIVLVD
ncbi:hypothetical protein PTKIN_Ptkin07bG0110100 [Pterospermum kingtungense]